MLDVKKVMEKKSKRKKKKETIKKIEESYLHQFKAQKIK